MSATDDALAKVITSNRFASARDVDDARVWGQKHHPDKELGDVLLLKGVVDKTKLGLARRMAKLSSGSTRRPADAELTGDLTRSEQAVLDEVDAGAAPTGTVEAPTRADETAELKIPTDDEAQVPGPTVKWRGVVPVPPDAGETSELPPVKAPDTTPDPARDPAPDPAPDPAIGIETPAAPIPAASGPQTPLAPTPAAPVAAAKAPAAPPKGAPRPPSTPTTEASGARKRGSREGKVPAPPASAQAKVETRPAPRPDAAKNEVRITTRPYEPTHVGRYTILERIAKGGMGIVYKARHPDLDRFFAVKLLTAKVAQSEEAMARFQREAKIAARLDHPNIVRVHDAGTEEGGAPYLVMDFIAGPTLEKLVKEEGVGVRKAAQVARSLALALHHAHERGIVHRDVKPDNVILEADTGEPKITDFGIVKDLEGDEDERKLTQTGFTLGSPCYMSPEQASGKHDLVGPTSDVYSLAATLYQMLTGVPPFDGDSIHAIMMKVVTQDPEPVRKRNAAVPQDLESICMKALEKEPGRRYASAKAFADDLACFLAEEPTLAKPPNLLTKMRRRLRRHRGGVVMIAIALAALGVVLGMAWREREERRRQEVERLGQTLAAADRCLDAAERTVEPTELRKAYYDALLHLEDALRQAPGHPPALDRKRRTVLALGDHLVESGDASFAEFVFRIGESVAEPAEIASRIEAARLNLWLEQASKAEATGDLDEALRLYKEGQSKLREAGYSGRRLDPKVADLERQRADRRRAEEVGQLVALAESASRVGDHLGALLAYRRAQALAPDDRDVSAQVDLHRQKAVTDVARARGEADAARARAATVLAPDAAEEARRAVDADLATGDGHLRKGTEAASQEDYAAAQRELEQAAADFITAYAHASALHGKGQVERAAREAEERNAARYAPTELGKARDNHARANDELQRGKYEDALVLFEQAAQWYRQAGRTGSGKEVVAEARAQAQETRARAAQALTQQQRTTSYAVAEEDFSQAEAHYQKGEYAQARDLYAKAQERFAKVLEKATITRDAFAVRARVRNLRVEAEAQRSRDFAAEDYTRANQSESAGDQALDKEDPAAAVEAYNEAVYRYGNAIRKALPMNTGARECEDLRIKLDALKHDVETRGLEWKPAYKDAMADAEQGERYYGERSWRLAKRRFESALRKLEPLVGR